MCKSLMSSQSPTPVSVLRTSTRTQHLPVRQVHEPYILEAAGLPCQHRTEAVSFPSTSSPDRWLWKGGGDHHLWNPCKVPGTVLSTVPTGLTSVAQGAHGHQDPRLSFSRVPGQMLFPTNGRWMKWYTSLTNLAHRNLLRTDSRVLLLIRQRHGDP